VSGKKETKLFLVISSTKLGRFWYVVPQINLLQNHVNTSSSHLNNVYTQPCATQKSYCARATTELLKKLKNLSHLNCGLQIHLI